MTMFLFLIPLIIINKTTNLRFLKKTLVNPILISLLIMYIYVVLYELIIGIPGGTLYLQTFSMFLIVGLFTIMSFKNYKYTEQILPGFLFGTVITYLTLYLLVDIQSLDIAYNRDLVSYEYMPFNTITFGRDVGLIFVAMVFQLIITKNNILKILSIGFAVLSLYYIFITGTRGVWAAIILVYSLMFSVQIRNNNIRNYMYIFIIIFYLASNLIDFGQFSLFNRFKNLQADNLYIGSRYWIWYQALQMFIAEPFVALGPGGFKGIYGTYPHNFILEIILEYGFISLIVLPFLVIYGFKKSIQIFRNDHINSSIKIVPLLWLYYFFNTMISGDIPINQLWFLLSFLLVVIIVFIDEDYARNKQHIIRTQNELLEYRLK